MHRAAFLLLAFAVSSTLLVAQSADQHQPQATAQQFSKAPDGSAVVTTLSGEKAQALIARLPNLGGCPVSLQVQQRANAFSREASGTANIPPGTGDRSMKDIAQKLHLTAIGQGSKRIVSANVTVRGYANKSRYMPISATSNDYDAFRTLKVRFSPDPEKGDAADFAVPGLTAVGAVDLNAVTYEDGSTWKIAGNQSCRAWINGLMLVSGR